MNHLLCDILSNARNDEITITLLLTRKCPFECDHCFYGCSPRESGSYMSDAVLQSVREFYDELNRLEIRARFNLIGGEPTVNMREFARVLETVTGWYDFTGTPARVEMVTNGWWLHRRETAERFFEVIKPYVLANDSYDHQFTISISDDRYHRDFRPGGFPAIRTIIAEMFEEGGSLDSCFYDRPLFSKKVFRCGYCGEEYSYRRTTCTSCGRRDIFAEFESINDLPGLEGEIAWIAVKDADMDDSGVIPSGIRGTWGLNDVAKSQGCAGVHNLAFDPTGKLTDGCCRGSDLPFGSVRDHPLVLMALVKEFKQNAYSCRDCRACAKYFAQSLDFKKMKQSMIDDIRDDETIDWYQPRVSSPRYRLITLEEQSLQEAI